MTHFYNVWTRVKENLLSSEIPLPLADILLCDRSVSLLGHLRTLDLTHVVTEAIWVSTGEIQGVGQQSHILGLLPKANLSLTQLEPWSSPAQGEPAGREEGIGHGGGWIGILRDTCS